LHVHPAKKSAVPPTLYFFSTDTDPLDLSVVSWSAEKGTWADADEGRALTGAYSILVIQGTASSIPTSTSTQSKLAGDESAVE
jgi:hypothetical protein